MGFQACHCCMDNDAHCQQQSENTHLKWNDFGNMHVMASDIDSIALLISRRMTFCEMMPCGGFTPRFARQTRPKLTKDSPRNGDGASSFVSSACSSAGPCLQMWCINILTHCSVAASLPHAMKSHASHCQQYIVSVSALGTGVVEHDGAFTFCYFSMIWLSAMFSSQTSPCDFCPTPLG